MGVRQMGHFSACMRRTWAHSEHRHMWRQGSTVVSRGAVIQTTHSRPLSPPSPSADALASSLGPSMPKISWSS